MTKAPRLSIGLPVYNGSRYLSESIDALLVQSFDDFELIISDNCSTDDTADICRAYAATDTRIRYFRQPRNIGLAPNHNFCADASRGELFKWASSDDLYHPRLLEACIDVLDSDPSAVVAHSWTSTIGETGDVIDTPEYALSTSSPSAPERFRSCLVSDIGGDDIYGVIRFDVLRKVLPHRSHHHSDRTLVAELCLQGPFHQVAERLYYRRVHPQQAEQACRTTRARCANMDPRRADPIRNPALRLYGEYIWAYVDAVRRSSLTPAERRQCYHHLAAWGSSRGRTRVDRALKALSDRSGRPTKALAESW